MLCVLRQKYCLEIERIIMLRPFLNSFNVLKCPKRTAELWVLSPALQRVSRCSALITDNRPDSALFPPEIIVI
jgi:hypothetical protein